MESAFAVTVSSGVLREPAALVVPHAWTPDGVTVTGAFTGAHLLHLAVGGCVLNDVHREAQVLGLPLDGVRVGVSGDFDRTTWASTGIGYRIQVVSTASSRDLDALLDRVEEVAEIPKAVAAGAPVRRLR